MTHSDIIAALSDLHRRFENLLRIGVIAAVDHPRARVQVSIGRLTTDWLPWLTHRAGNDRTWHAPEVGEQVLVLSPSGDLNQGVVLPALYRTAHPPNGDAATVDRTTYADGAVIEYDRATHALVASGIGSAHLVASGEIRLKAASIMLDGPVVTTGAITASGHIADLDGAQGTLGLLRSRYNAHRHTCSGPGGTSSASDQPAP